MQETASITRKGRVVERLARKKGWERRLRHRSRVEKLKALPRVHEGRTLNEQRLEMD